MTAKGMFKKLRYKQCSNVQTNDAVYIAYENRRKSRIEFFKGANGECEVKVSARSINGDYKPKPIPLKQLQAINKQCKELGCCIDTNRTSREIVEDEVEQLQNKVAILKEELSEKCEEFKKLEKLFEKGTKANTELGERLNKYEKAVASAKNIIKFDYDYDDNDFEARRFQNDILRELEKVNWNA